VISVTKIDRASKRCRMTATLAIRRGARHLEPMKEMQAIVRELTASGAGDSVLATLVSVRGSSYRRPGARLLVRADGSRLGSISGGCLEEDVIARASAVYKTGTPDLVTYDTTSENDLVWGVGLGCHGVVDVLLEKLSPQPEWAREIARNFEARRSTRVAVIYRAPAGAAAGTALANATLACPTEGVFLDTILPPTALYIFGAGDDAQPLARLAKELGWYVTVADPRPAFATANRFPMANRVVVGGADQLVGKLGPGADALAVIMTHHYIHDVPLLRDLLKRPLAYLGLLGPRKRAERILEDLRREGHDAAANASGRLHAPIGLDLGADAPEQVALAMIAEMQAVLTGRNAQPLRERTRPIHS
jgi:xanthine dehydrogenase accessory factor